jgi:hypothetical protein
MAEHDHGQALDAFCVGPTALKFAYHRFYGNARANRITTSCNSRYSTHTYSRLLPRPASTVYNILPFRRYRTYIRRASEPAPMLRDQLRVRRFAESVKNWLVELCVPATNDVLSQYVDNDRAGRSVRLTSL